MASYVIAYAFMKQAIRAKLMVADVIMLLTFTLALLGQILYQALREKYYQYIITAIVYTMTVYLEKWMTDANATIIMVCWQSNIDRSICYKCD